ncbi:hypothetical protein [Desulforhopalus sp. 52FAK]
MGYDGVAVSGSDVGDGGQFIQDSLEMGMPWVSANLISPKKTINVPTYRLIQRGSLTIAITGITDIPINDKVYSVTPYRTALTTVIEELSGKYDIFIVLSNLRAKENNRLASLFPEIDVLLSSDSSLGKMSPVVIGKTLITQTSSRGKYIGLLNIEWNDGEQWNNGKLPSISDLKSRQTRLLQAIEQLKNDENAGKRLTRLELQEKRLAMDIEKLLDEQKAGLAYNTHALSFFPVRPSTSPEDIEAIVQTIDKRSRNK